MGSKSVSKASSSSSKPAKSSKSARAAAASPPAASRVVSRETVDDSDADMASSSEAERAVVAKASSTSKPKPRLVAEDSDSESPSGSESSSAEEDDDDEQVQAGTSQTLNFVPPRHMQKVVLASGSDFDYAKLLSNPKLQLYTIRLPDNVKTKSLEKLSLSVNESGVGLTGSLSTKAGEYIVKAADPQGAAEELKNLRLLLPNAKSSAYVSAPRPLTGALSLAPIIPIASSSNLPPSSASAPKSRMYVPPPKPVRLQPLDKMKFRNAAFGGGAELPVSAPLDDETSTPVASVAVAQASGKDAKADKKSKKRKEVGEAGEGEAKEKKKKKPKVK